MEALTTLFTGTAGLVTGICLLVGLILVIIEIFVPGFGIFGISGSILLIFSVIYRVSISGNLLHLVYLLAIIILTITLSVLIAIRSARFGWISKTPIVEKTTALPSDYASDKKNYGFLLNKKGITKTICKPVGKMEYDNIEYQVTTNGDYIDAGVKVKVIEVDGSTIIVKKDEDKK